MSGKTRRASAPRLRTSSQRQPAATSQSTTLPAATGNRVEGAVPYRPATTTRNSSPLMWGAVLLAAIVLAYLGVVTFAPGVLPGWLRLWNSGQAAIDGGPLPGGVKSRISFVRTSQGGSKRDLFVVNSDGSNQQQVTDGLYVEGSAFWSPDGTKIVLQASISGTSTVVLLPVGSGNKAGQGVQLTADAKADSVLPAWSPDGTKIAFQSKRDGGDYQVFVMDADGSNKKRVSDGKGFAGNPAWSPDGKSLVYIQGADSTAEGVRELCVVSLDTGTSHQITNLNTSLGHPRWSPKGDLISFVQTMGQYDARIMTVKPDGTDLRTLVLGGLNSGQEFSSDGTKLVYYKVAPGQGENVYSVDVADGKETDLTQGGVGSYLPAWSPDGTKLAWARKATSNENYRIVVANADGTSAHAVSQGDGGDDYQPAWGKLR